MTAVEIVYKGRNNTNDLRLKADGVIADLSGVTKMGIVSAGLSFDSDTEPDAFDWTIGDGVVHLSLGGVDSLCAGLYNMSLIVFDDDNTDGINWGEFRLRVKDL